MIIENGKYYLYRFIRLDKNEPFYIGIGTKHRNKYTRLWDIKTKSNIFKKIINKTQFTTQIILESDNYSFIKEKEIEFIKLYGRKDLGTGILSNLTDGGEGITGAIGKFGKENPLSKKVYQYDLEGNFIKKWDSLSDIQRELGYTLSSVARCCRKQISCITYKNFQWSYKNNITTKIKKYKNLEKIIIQYDMNLNKIKKWNSATEAGAVLNISNKCISKCANNNLKSYKGFIWKFEEVEELSTTDRSTGGFGSTGA